MQDTKEQILENIFSTLTEVILESEDDATDFLNVIFRAIETKFPGHVVELSVQDPEKAGNLEVASDELQELVSEILSEYAGRLDEDDVRREICERISSAFPQFNQIDFLKIGEDGAVSSADVYEKMGVEEEQTSPQDLLTEREVRRCLSPSDEAQDISDECLRIYSYTGGPNIHIVNPIWLTAGDAYDIIYTAAGESVEVRKDYVGLGRKFHRDQDAG